MLIHDGARIQTHGFAFLGGRMSDHPNSLRSKIKRQATARGCSSGSSIKKRVGFLLSPQGSSQQQGDCTCGNSSLSTGASCWDAISCFLWVVPHPSLSTLLWIYFLFPFQQPTVPCREHTRMCTYTVTLGMYRFTLRIFSKLSLFQ